ncbi:MAG: hypothetical protein Tsb002_24060 [Wenzhouxiangellaceae bacterium]
MKIFRLLIMLGLIAGFAEISQAQTVTVVLKNGKELVSSNPVGVTRFYRVDVPPGSVDLNISTSGGGGEVDLYVRHGSRPTLETYDCRPYKWGNDEACVFDEAQGGSYHVMLVPYDTYENVTLLASFTPALQKLDPVYPDGSVYEQRYVMNVPTNVESMSIETEGGTGDADMYVKFGEPASRTNYDCRPYEIGNDEQCTFDQPQTGRYFVLIEAYEEYSGMSLVSDYYRSGRVPPYTSISIDNGEQLTNLNDTQGSVSFFSITVPSDAQDLAIDISGGAGEVDMYVKHENMPSLNTFDCRPWEWGNDESCNFSGPEAGIYYIMLNAYETYSGLTLSASYKRVLTNRQAITDINGLIFDIAQSQQYFEFEVPAGASRVSFETSAGIGDLAMYVKRGSRPTTSSFDYSDGGTGTNASRTITNPLAGTYHVMLDAAGDFGYSGVNLIANYSLPDDADADGVIDSLDTCPDEARVTTTISELPRSSAECSVVTWNRHLSEHIEGDDGLSDSVDDCDQYAMTEDERKSLTTFYHAATNEVGMTLCDNLGPYCRIVRGAKGIYHFFHKDGEPEVRDQITADDLLDAINNAGAQPDLGDNTQFANNFFGHIQGATSEYLQNVTDIQNKYVVYPTERTVASLFHKAFNVDENHLYCSMKAGSDAIYEFEAGVVIGIEDIPVFFESLVEHPILTIGDMARFAYAFAVDPGEGIRSFINVDFEQDSGSQVAFNMGRIFGNFVPDMLGIDILPAAAKEKFGSMIAGITEGPKVIEFATINARELLNGQLAKIVDGLTTATTTEDFALVQRNAEIFVEKLTSLKSSIQEIRLVRMKFQELRGEIALAMDLGQESLELVLGDSTVDIPEHLFAPIDSALEDAVDRLYDHEVSARVDSDMASEQYSEHRTTNPELPSAGCP